VRRSAQAPGRPVCSGAALFLQPPSDTGVMPDENPGVWGGAPESCELIVGYG
jgi:hypothetical protein